MLRKFIVLLLSAVLTLILVTSCNSEGSNPDESAAQSAKQQELKMTEISYSDTVSDNNASVKLSESDIVKYKVVISNCDATSEEASFVRSYANKLCSIINEKTGGQTVLTDDTATSEGYEIVIGNTAYESTELFKSEVPAAAYGIKITDEKIIVYGHGPRTVALAVDELISYIDNSETVDGTLTVVMPETIIKYNPNWFYNIPEFTGGSLLGTNDSSRGDMLLVYNNTSRTDFDSYCRTLKSLGYELYYDFKPFYGSYSTFVKGDNMLHIYYTVNNGETHIITGEADSLAPMEECYTVEQTEPSEIHTLTGAEYSEKKQYDFEVVTEPKITQMNFDYSNDQFGMCYVITLSDGSFIIYDGGMNNNPEHVRLWNLLNKLNKRPDGKIVIAAWVITHVHADHWRNYAKFAEVYGSQAELEYLIVNPSDDSEYMEDTTDLSTYLQYFEGNPKTVIPHTGQRIQIRDAVMQVIYTHDDLYPVILDEFNDTSTATRIELAGQSFFVLGDAQINAANVMTKVYGSVLDSDFVQITHHGYGDVTYELYEDINASFAFWPHEYYEYYLKYTLDFTSEKERTQFWTEKYIIYNLLNRIEVADFYTKTIVLPFDLKYGEVIYEEIPTD